MYKMIYRTKCFLIIILVIVAISIIAFSLQTKDKSISIIGFSLQSENKCEYKYPHENTDDKNMIIYNRIPKTGSSSFKHLIKNLSPLNSFVYRDEHNGGLLKLATTQLSELKGQIESTVNKTMLVRHMYFEPSLLNINTGLVYINFVRDPVKTFASAFYYRRSNTTKFGKNRFSVMVRKYGERSAKQWREKTLGECVKDKKDPECSGDLSSKGDAIHRFFCERKCNSATAIENIDKYYSVVGVLEDMDKTLSVLEFQLPGFFFNATALWRKLESENKTRQNKVEHPEPDEETSKLLKEMLKDDYMTYYYVKSKLTQKYQEIRKMKKKCTTFKR